MPRLHNHMMRMLIVDIVSGHAAPGQRLRREADLAEEFRVSRGVAREALRGLEERGLVRVKHGRGTIVAESAEWNILDADVLTVVLESDGRAGVLREFVETRMIFEVEAAGLAAERATDEDLEVISDALAHSALAAERAQRNPAAAEAFTESDLRFHRAVINGAHNRVLARLTGPVRRALILTQSRTRHDLRFKEGMAQHNEIARAIANRDPESARRAMTTHLTSVAQILYSSVEQGIREPESGSTVEAPRE